MTQEVSLMAAFFAGLVSFAAPCILPLIPPYFAWLLGISRNGVQKKDVRVKVVLHGAILVLGFSIIFVVLGAGASFLGQTLAPYRLPAQRVGGLLLVLFGLEFAGFLKVFKNRLVGLFKNPLSKINPRVSSFVVGLTFAFAWVACFSPILGSILVLASFQGTLSQGVVLLSFYSLGLAVPFLLTALFLGFVIDKIQVISRVAEKLVILSGLTLIGLGVLLYIDRFYQLVAWLSQ